MTEKRVYDSKALVLKKIPKGATLIEGFPGFGLVATISTGFLLDHLKWEKIGSYYFEEAHPTIAIHECKIVDPIGIYHNKKYNLILIHAITSASGIEWAAADLVLDVCKRVDAKEIVSIEGVGSTTTKEPKTFWFTRNKTEGKKYEKKGYTCIGEGIIIGVTSALLLKSNIPMTCLFAETRMKLPDSKAAAKIIETLDKLFGLKVDFKPLLKQAAEVEEKLKSLLKQAETTKKDAVDKKKLSYIA